MHSSGVNQCYFFPRERNTSGTAILLETFGTGATETPEKTWCDSCAAKSSKRKCRGGITGWLSPSQVSWPAPVPNAQPKSAIAGLRQQSSTPAEIASLEQGSQGGSLVGGNLNRKLQDKSPLRARKGVGKHASQPSIQNEHSISPQNMLS